jgi:hypothetical protein
MNSITSGFEHLRCIFRNTVISSDPPIPLCVSSAHRAVAESGSIPTVFVSQAEGHHSQGQPTHHGPSRVIYLQKNPSYPYLSANPLNPVPLDVVTVFDGDGYR